MSVSGDAESHVLRDGSNELKFKNNDLNAVNLAMKFDQSHILTFMDELKEDDRTNLLKSIQDIDFDVVCRFSEHQQHSVSSIEERLSPPDLSICESLDYLRATNLDKLGHYFEVGLKAVREGKVAVLLLAGGQGTRLGVNYPKGLFSPGLPSDRSLYQLQAERIRRVLRLTEERFGSSSNIPWYIMTSEHTMDSTVDFFKKHHYFGHIPENIVFFEQFTLPIFDFNGKILMESKSKVAMAPDGNGGLYRALWERRILDDMKTRGVQYVQIYCVDNILVKLPDVHFMGYCMEQAVDCGAQVVQKTQPTEPIGVIGVVDGRYQVVEYSEISSDLANMRHACDPNSANCNGFTHTTGENNGALPRLVYGHGNICVHFATRSFLERVSRPSSEYALKRHVARKKTPHVDLQTGEKVMPSEPNAFKFEKFVFDVFPFAERFAIWEVPRTEQFSPIKNGPSAMKDCPKTALSDLLAYHKRLALAAGARFSTCNGSGGDNTEAVLEISPLVSYDGENLSALKGQLLEGVNVLELDPETNQPYLKRVV